MSWKKGAVVEFFKPNKKKILLSIPIILFLWFFPIVGKIIYAVPWRIYSFLPLSLLMNLIFAYTLSCSIVGGLSRNSKLILIILLAIIYLSVPKISLVAGGDIGWQGTIYCDCHGYEWGAGACCHAGVRYCRGICKRNESTWRTSGMLEPLHVSRGQDIYNTLCAGCHAMNGKGTLPGTSDYTNVSFWEKPKCRDGLSFPTLR
ncbi:MAG: c-type cytochrome [Candidatus Hodarchaeales archaeon]|jgi:hypothetical protein